MSKTYRVSYKTYFNERLKQVYLHGQLTYPLYVQVTYNRKTIFFKSYYFELFSKPKYLLTVSGKTKWPSIKEIISKENEVIEFVIGKHPENFSLELFKQEYTFYSKDLCDDTEAGFIDYLYTFFQDEGMPALAATIRNGNKFQIPYDIIRDLKKGLIGSLFKKLQENSFYYASPYLPLYGFMEQTKRWPMLILTVMEWEKNETKALFTEYITKSYPGKDAYEIKKQVENYVSFLRSELL